MTERDPTESYVAGAGGLRLRTLLWNAVRPRGTILLVHGFNEHAARWAPVASRLASEGFNVFAFDQRGHGRSEGGRGQLESFDLLVEDAYRAREAAMAVLPAGGPPLLYGHSLGALVVLRLLQTYRPAAPGAVLSAPWLATAAPIPWSTRLAAMVLRIVAPDKALHSRGLAERLTRDPEAQRAYREDTLIHHRISPRFFDEVVRAQLVALESGVEETVPTLLIVPMADVVASPEVTLAWAGSTAGDHVRVETLPGSPHEPHNDIERERVLTLLVDWMGAHFDDVAQASAE